MTEDALVPPDVEALIGVAQYEEVGEFPVERGYIWTTCSSVENGNPLYWDDAVAEAVTGGPIAPPTMLSVWFRRHRWALQIHFDLKERFDLPEAVISDNTLVLYEPVRVGDVLRTHQVLRSVTGPKRTRLGLGRFWTIDVECSNQHGQPVGTDTYVGFGYRREAAS
jgi:acyl dehydratase